VTREEELRWEARWAPFAGIASIVAGFLTVLSVPLFLPKDRKGVKATADFLLSIHDEPSAYIVSSVVSALAALLLLGVFLYLFRAVTARGAGVPQWFVYLVIGAPLAYAISRVAYAIQSVDVSDQFAASGQIRGEAGNDRATDLLNGSALVGGLQVAGTVGVAFLFVMLPLRARRVGLLTPFMGVLGAIAGALVVIPLAGVSSLVLAFWLALLGMLFLGRWPGGRGPAWESGEAEPWPTAARQRMQPGGGEPAAPRAGRTQSESEPVPERPPSRKRRKKRR
jgi:hypothetical protein